jgi:hypothetical protein
MKQEKILVPSSTVFMKSFFLYIVIFFAGILNTYAQRICGSSDYKQQMVEADPSVKTIFKNIEKQIVAFNGNLHGNTANRDTAANEIISVPVVIHVIYKNAVENISDAQIKSQIEALNNDFSLLNSDRVNTPAAFKPLAGEARIKFCLAQVDPQGKPSSGIERISTSQAVFAMDDAMKFVAKGGAASWDSKHYLNIWVCKLASRGLGYATPPGAAADKDGVVISYDVFGTTGTLRAPFNKGRTATHEVGHWLGLIHIWGDASCGNDQVDDTPTQQSYNFGCQSFPKISSCSVDNNGDMFMNFMDFSDDACMNIFTKGQVKRMRALFAKGNIRNEFLASFGCDSTLAQNGPLPTPTVDVKLPVSISLATTKVFPSPVETVTTIDCKAASALTVKNLDIFNSVGVRVFTARLSQEKTILNLSNLVAGIYIIHIADGVEKFTTKIIKQ